MLGLRERMEENGTAAPPSMEGKRSAAAPPDPEVVDKPTRRRFAPSYKQRIVEEADHPFSEAQFKTLKYHPSFPGRFDDQGQAKNFCRSFFPWYNAEHRHGGISMLTPEQVHFGLADEIIARREAVLRAAWAAHPDRFVSGEPKPKPLPEAVWINPPTPTLTTQEIALQLIPPSVSQPLTGSASATLGTRFGQGSHRGSLRTSACWRTRRTIP